MKKSLFVLIALISSTTGWNTILAESTADETPMVPAATQVDADVEDSPTSLTLGGSVLPRDPNRQTDSSDYPLFRPHARKYYPQKTARTAILLSATLPGLGQTYSGRPGRGLSFLAAGIGLIAMGGFHLDRAITYNDRSNRFMGAEGKGGFDDPYSDNFLTVNQGHVKARGHAQFSVLFLASGIGVYIWNIFDAAKTVDQYNERRFPVQAQQSMYGEPYLTINRRF